MRFLTSIASHAFVGALGFAAGIYFLPILTAPEAPPVAELRAAADASRYTGEFRRDLEGSDALHWGEGTVFVGDDSIALDGKIAPGPDYRLYLSPEFVETEADFERLKSTMVEIGPVRTFDNFVVPVPTGTDISSYTSVIIWCESFSQFITAARYGE
jgi:hypothetical protein